MTARSPYPCWGSMTDTAEIPSYRRSIPLAEQPTHEIAPLRLLPDLAPQPRRRPFRRLLAVLGVTAVIAGLLAAEVAVTALVPVAGIQ